MNLDRKRRRKRKSIFKFESEDKKEYEFKNESVFELFKHIDKLETEIREKYYSDDIEYIDGVQRAKVLKGQIRRLDVDAAKLYEIRYKGMLADDIPEETDTSD